MPLSQTWGSQGLSGRWQGHWCPNFWQVVAVLGESAVGGRSRVPHVCVEKIMGDKSVRQASREVGVPLHMGSLESTVSTGEGNGAVITGQLG